MNNIINVKYISDIIEYWAPKKYSEDYDNVGLLIGSYDQKVNKILITLDTTEDVLNEAINKKCDLIITFHPIIFNKLKTIISTNRIESLAIKAIKNNISIYSIHTNLDNIYMGNNYNLSNILSLKKTKILIPKNNTLKKLTTYIPKKYANNILNLLFKAGAGNIGNYSNCSYRFNGFGSFKCKKNANPKIGIKNNINLEEETCINVIFNSYQENDIKKVLFENHPYEEVAYEIYNLENNNKFLGIGIIGDLNISMSEISFLKFLKEKLKIKFIKHSNFLNKKIKKVSIISGSGSFGISYAKEENADVFISCDLKYHNFFESDNKIFLIDIDHYECEKFNKEIIYSFLKKKLPNFDIIQSLVNTNPVHYHL